MASLYVASALLFVMAWLCFRMARLHRKLASAYQLISDMLPEDNVERRLALAQAERASRTPNDQTGVPG